MIDLDRLSKDYAEDGFYALQLEVGDTCKQGCIYCYMNALPLAKNSLSDRDITGVLSDAKELGVTAIEWLGGEPLLRGSIFEHMAEATTLGLRNNMWTGGLPFRDGGTIDRCVASCKHGLISVHVSTVDPLLYATLHPNNPASDLADILAGVRRVLDAGYPPGQMLNSVTYTGLQPADDMVSTIDYFEREFGIATSLNVYHTYLRPGIARAELERFIPRAADVAKVYRRYTEQSGQDAIPMNCVNKHYCSATLAVLCDGSVTPCATIRADGAPNIHVDGGLLDIARAHRDTLVFKALKDPANLPPACQDCFMRGSCWGCRSRAFAAGRGLHGHDPRCFRSREPGR